MKCLIVSIMCVFVITATSYCQSADTISDDVWTMTRLIGGELKKEFPGRYFAGLGKDQRCMGFYLKDYGAVFVAQVYLDIFDYRNIESGKKSEPGDLWDKYKNDSEPTAWSMENKQDSEKRMNQQVNQIKRLEQFLVDIICNYAGNMDRLPPDEYITIAVKGNRDLEYPFFEILSKGDNKDKPDEKPTHLTIRKTKGFTLRSSYGVRSSSGDHGQYLIMKIKKKDISGDCSDKIEISFN